MSETICNKPCIIENQQGFLVVFCTRPQGHEPEWCLTRQGPRDSVTIQWRYGWFEQREYVRETRRRPCDEPIEISGNRIKMWDFAPSCSFWSRWRLNRDTDTTPLFLACEEEASGEGFSSVHIGHECYGVFAPLGIQWYIKW
jgi:hypothetical protein